MIRLILLTVAITLSAFACTSEDSLEVGRTDGGVADQEAQAAASRLVDGTTIYAPDSRLAGEISHATLRPEEIGKYTGLGYESYYSWKDTGTGDIALAESLANDGFGTKRQVLDTMHETGFLRTHQGDMSSTHTPPGCIWRAHRIIITTLVFGTREGAEGFFQRVIPPTRGEYASEASTQPVSYFLKEEDSLVGACGALITETAWVAAGPFVVSVVEIIRGDDHDPTTNAVDYADDQLLKLREDLPQYFTQR